MTRFEEALTTAGVTDTSSLAYIKRVRDLTRMTMMTTTSSTPQPPQTGSSDSLFRGFSSLSNRLTDRLASVPGASNLNLDTLISGVKNFLPANRDLTLTKITESIMDPSTASSSAIAKTENYLYFDPRSANARGTAPVPRPNTQTSNMPGGLGSLGPGTGASFGQRRQGFSEAIVFTVGGGSMDEYGNLQDWAKRTSQAGGAAAGTRRRVVYGSTDLTNAEEFLESSLGVLGKEG
jgi:hypothetical protein